MLLLPLLFTSLRLSDPRIWVLLAVHLCTSRSVVPLLPSGGEWNITIIIIITTSVRTRETKAKILDGQKQRQVVDLEENSPSH